MAVGMQQGEIHLDDDDEDSFEKFADSTRTMSSKSCRTAKTENKNCHSYDDNRFPPQNAGLIEENIISCLKNMVLKTTGHDLKTAVVKLLQQISTLSADHKQFTIEIAIPYLISCVSTGSQNYREKCLCILGYFADGDKYYRDFMLDHGILTTLEPLIIWPVRPEVIVQNFSQLLYYLCQEKHGYPNYKKVSSIYRIATEILQNFTNPQTLINCCKTLTNLAIACNEGVVPETPCERLFYLLSSESIEIVDAALTAFSHIAKCKNSRRLLIKYLPILFSTGYPPIIIKSCKVMSQLSEVTVQRSFIHRFVAMELYKKLLEIIKTEPPEVLVPALKAITTGIINGPHEFTSYLTNIGLIQCLCNNVIKQTDINVIDSGLDCVDKLINLQKPAANQIVNIANMLTQNNGIERIRELQYQQQDLAIRDNARKIICRYCEITKQ